MKSLRASEFRLVRDLLAYSIREYVSIVPIMLLGVISSLIELAAVFSIIPLGILSGGKPIATTSLLYKLPAMLGFIPDAKFYVIVFLTLMLLRMLTFMATQILNSYVMQTLMAHFSTHAYATFISHLPFEQILKHQIGHFVTLAGDEANRGAQIVVGVMKLVPVAFLFLAYIGALFYQSWTAGLALLALLTMSIVSLRNAFKKSLALGQRQQDESRTAGTHFIESLSGLRTVRGFTAEGFVTSHYSSLMKNYSWTLFVNDTLSQLTQLPAMILIAGLLGVVAVYANASALIRDMPFILAAIMIFMRLQPIANQGLEAALKLTANLKAGRNVADMLMAVSASDNGETLPVFPAAEQITRIDFDRVSFRYSADTPFILDDFTCSFEAGTSYAVVGPSGVGKSSLVDLLLRFFDPVGGRILVNGRDISRISNSSLRQHIILAEQATRIFHGTVLENVQFGHMSANEEANAALQAVGLQDLLSILPDGAETVLSFQGSNFSGGQRQRVGLARALIRTADVLILDESTNALDQITRERILDILLEDYGRKIIIFVTHDPYVINRVSKVVRLGPSSGELDFPSVAADGGGPSTAQRLMADRVESLPEGSRG